MSYKLGRLAATRPFGVANLSEYAVGRLPKPPASVDVPDAPYPMDGNDRYGCCVVAGAAHCVAAWNTDVHESEPVPSESSVVNTYFTMTGGEDSGLNEHSFLETWRTGGIWGKKIDAYVPVNPKNLVEIQQSVAFYGACYLGIMVPQSAQSQFQANAPWTYVPGSPIEGGHCIAAFGYTQTSLLCATWGGIAEVTYGFLAHFLDESWCILPSQWVEAGRGPALALNVLRADLSQL